MVVAPLAAMSCGVIWLLVESFGTDLLREVHAFRWVIVSRLFWPFVLGFSFTFTTAVCFIASFFLEYKLSVDLEAALGRSIIAVKEWEKSLLSRRTKPEVKPMLRGYQSGRDFFIAVVTGLLIVTAAITYRLGDLLAGIQVLVAIGVTLMLSVPFLSKVVGSYESRELYIDTLRNRLALICSTKALPKSGASTSLEAETEDQELPN